MMSEYFNFTRREIRPLLPERSTNILEVGAASGATLRWLKSIYPAARTTGVEINSSLLPELQRNADVAIIGPIQDCIKRLERYDLILLLDVLEHLDNSLDTLRQIANLLLTPHSGKVIVSLPNIAHYSVSVPLLFRRRFEYQDAGILDRTHVIFFVEQTAIQLLNDADLIVTKGVVNGLQGPRAKLLNHFTLGVFRHYLVKQYIMLGEHKDGRGQPKVMWQVAR